MTKYDWSGLNRDLLARCPAVLHEWFPAGKQQGNYFCIGNLYGDAGDSLKVSLTKGTWRDYAGSDDDHGDLVGLYARSRGLGMGDAARELGGERLANGAGRPPARPQANGHTVTPPAPEAPPAPAETPSLRHPRFGPPAGQWCIRDADGHPIHYVARYDTEDGKEVVPWTWDGHQWRMKGPAALRPLYGLDRLAAEPEKGVVVVEGEKCADVAQALLGSHYVAVTWTGGSSAVPQADWAPLHGRKVLIWPDADKPGKQAAQRIAGLLVEHCPRVVLVNVDDQESKWDIADGDWKDGRELMLWLRPRVVPYEAAAIVQLPAPEAPPPDAAEYTSIRHAVEDLGLLRTDRGKPIANMANAAAVLERHPRTAGTLWFNAFANQSMVGDDDIRDEHINAWVHWMQTEFDLTSIGSQHVYEGVTYVARKNTRNPVADYLGSVTWDGQGRIDTFFPDYCGCAFDDYHQTASKNFWISMAARVLKPGCEVHQMVVLHGRQGLGKTSLFKIVGGPWFTTCTDSLDDKDFFMGLRGRLIVEIGEMDSFSKSDIGRVKLIVTSSTDRMRDPYARITSQHPRAGILVGSTNEPQFLQDHTGGRRFVPIEMTRRLDMERLEAERDQLFAEAVVRYRQGEPWHIEAPEAAQHQELARQEDPWEDEARGFLSDRLTVTVRELLDHLKIDPGQRQRLHQARAYKVLHALGWGSSDRKTWRRLGSL